jgi:hypothetical protein
MDLDAVSLSDIESVHLESFSRPTVSSTMFNGSGDSVGHSHCLTERSLASSLSTPPLCSVSSRHTSRPDDTQDSFSLVSVNIQCAYISKRRYMHTGFSIHDKGTRPLERTSVRYPRGTCDSQEPRIHAYVQDGSG